MIYEEWKKFTQMVELYSQVGEVQLGEETDVINYIERTSHLSIHRIRAMSLYFDHMFEEEGVKRNAESLFEYIFGIDLEQLNTLADSFCYIQVDRFYPGWKVMVYEDPLTKQQEEGQATLISLEKVMKLLNIG